jgi:hyperosmotically inducible protein
MQPRPSLARITLATLVFAVAATSGIAPAADDSPHPSQLFLQLDTNHDGYISRSEAASARGFERAFAEADDNRDGRLSADEFIKAESIRERQRAAEFAADSLITAKVKAALIKDLQLKAFDVAVETNHGRVLLSGVVDDQQQAKRAAQLALAVSGVERVETALKPR